MTTPTPIEALRELVAVEDLRLAHLSTRSDPYYISHADHLESQYDRRQEPAWDAARAVLAAAEKAERGRKAGITQVYDSLLVEPPATPPSGWRMVPVASLVNVLQLIDPQPITVREQMRVFVNPNAAAILTRISAEVRAMLAASPSPTPAQAEPVAHRYRFSPKGRWNLADGPAPTDEDGEMQNLVVAAATPAQPEPAEGDYKAPPAKIVARATFVMPAAQAVAELSDAELTAIWDGGKEYDGMDGYRYMSHVRFARAVLAVARTQQAADAQTGSKP